ncbi:MAG: hydantoinase/oxoprolinase family protein [Desulfobacula sp.]|uniref:hydantoinase/oxoprolinase family protein n=1 Tax=Desulfobacula sp. TaxID=2593537 RepID=UPI002A02F709|nr:hydantoinase/oxoprolinase family protein [Desulfobacula sp.]
MKTLRIGIDVGGTFTDVVMVDELTGRFHYTKTPTTHKDLTLGVLKGLEEILSIGSVAMEDVDYIIHGTTIGTNAIIEGTGAKVGLITTAGFEDVLEIRRVARPKEAAFDFGSDNPLPLVPRFLRKGVIERVNSKGEIYTPLDEDSVLFAIRVFKNNKVDAIVVSLLFAFLNPFHEKRILEICKNELPDIPVSLSSEICPEFREYERTCTTVMNGYLGPVIKKYMDKLIDRLEQKYGNVTLHIMQSSGGTMSAHVAGDHAAHLINSGPAGGAIATAFISTLTGNEMAIGADMGGTTFDISIIDKHLPKTTTWGGVSNYPIKLPMVDLKTIGAGGGSIAWVDVAGALNVGPQSAGSSPGPACYGWGGVLPTVSDANLILGRLNPEYFLGGKLPLFAQNAEESIKKYIADKINISVEEAAAGILRIVNANMAKGISKNCVERGYDLREFSLVAMGGAAALHAVDIARDLSMARVIVPPMSGNFSAVGFVVADIQHDFVRTFIRKDYQVIPHEFLNTFLAMEKEALLEIKKDDVAEQDIELTWSADLRYEGQSWELNAPIEPIKVVDADDIKKIALDFHGLHQQVYSYSEPQEVVEFVNLRVRIKGKNRPVSFALEKAELTLMDKDGKGKRDVYFESIGWEKTPVLDRKYLSTGSKITGPCMIEETISTTLVPPDAFGIVDAFGNIIIEFEHDPHS